MYYIAVYHFIPTFNKIFNNYSLEITVFWHKYKSSNYNEFGSSASALNETRVKSLKKHRKIWKSVCANSGEYGGFGSTSQSCI